MLRWASGGDGLADFSVVVSSDFQTGGTWAGAVEALKAGWCPVFARDGAEVSKGNRELLKLGAGTLAGDNLQAADNLAEWLDVHARRKPVDRDLFNWVFHGIAGNAKGVPILWPSAFALLG